ncbi:eukaryotic mitochondrial regulator protein-domain-containing protein [Mucidula mucida]|nr:eukaryotic mitochondrial regulator protein-domain-containing protein [Mucidula mucida]
MFARSCLVLRAARLRALQPQRAPRMRPSLSTTAILRATPSLPLDQAADDLEGEMEDVEEDDMDEYDEEPEDNMEAEFEEDEEFDEEDRGAGTFDVDSNAAQDGRQTTFRTFLEENAKYKHATRPQWLAGHGPFPLNRSFRPEPPLSDEFREKLYRAHIRNPAQNSVRELSQRYHLSIGRVDAILRLKGMEKNWEEGKQLQTGFTAGMEMLLRVEASKEEHLKRFDMNESDEIEEEEGRQQARDRYERHYWESVDEKGEETTVPRAVQHADALARRAADSRRIHPGDPRLQLRVKVPSYVLKPYPIQRVSKTGRPDLKFVDVGTQFVDERTLTQRWKGGERRSKRAPTKRARKDSETETS